MPPFLNLLMPHLVFGVLAFAGLLTTSANPSWGIFVAMFVLALLGAAGTLFQKFLMKKVMKSSNSYQVSLIWWWNVS